MCNQAYSSPDFSSFLSFSHPFTELDYLTALSYRSKDLETYLSEIVRGVSRFIQSDWTIVTISSEDKGEIIASTIEMEKENSGFLLHGTLIEDVIQSGKPVIIPDSRQLLSSNKVPSNYLAYLGVPLKIGDGEVIGTICSFLEKPRLFLDSEVNIIELFAERTSIAIENHRLYQQQLRLNKCLSQEIIAYSSELKKSQENFLERERLAAIGEFTAMIVHEVRNPLTTIEMGLEYAERRLKSDADQERLTLAVEEAQRLNRLLQEILSYAKPQVLNLGSLDVSELLDDSISQVRELPEAKGRFVSYCRERQAIFVLADKDKLRQVFINLLRNALEAIPIQETVNCSIISDVKPGCINIRFHNKGKPIPIDILPKLTTPFCSTKPSGTGLGLAICKRIITAHKGELLIESSVAGTTVTVKLPSLKDNTTV